MCKEYNSELGKILWLTLAVTVVIVIVNIVLEIVVHNLVEWVGQDTIGNQRAFIVQCLVVTQFFNTSIILLLVNGNLTEHQPYAITAMLNGAYYDYSPNWYGNVGATIMLTQIIQAVLPWVNLLIAFLMKHLFYCKDRGCTNNIYKTSCKTMAAYKATYVGPEFLIHYTYANALTVAYTTFLFGIQMPIMFPLAALFMISTRITDRI